MAMWCELADEAKPLFEALLVRLQAVRDEVQRFYDTSTDQADRDRCLRGLKDELVKFSIELQCYYGVRMLTTPVELGARWSEKTFASRVIQHKKLHRNMYEIHGSEYASDGGLDRLFRLIKPDDKNYIEWRDPFHADVKEYEDAIADNVDNTSMLDVYKRDASLALEAVKLLRNAERCGDPYEWGYNEPAKHLYKKLKALKDLGTITLPDWFIPESDISYSKRLKSGSFGAVHVGRWASNTIVTVKCLVPTSDGRLDTELREAIIEEASFWFKLSHPYVLKLYGACHVTMPPFFVCEESREGDLSDFLKTDRGKSKLWRLLFQSALAIEYLHDKRIMRGNLKLSNIFVGGDGFARVADAGMSHFKQVMLREHNPTVRWCAPEALEDMSQIQSDVYSFAMCMIEAISGRIPYFDLPNDEEVRVKIGCGELPERPENMTDAEWELVKRMTVFDPKLRVTIKDVIPELMKRAGDELEHEIGRPICPDCSLKLEDGMAICPRCKRNIFKVDTNKSKEDVPARVELLTLSGNPQRRQLSTTLTDYDLIDQGDGTSSVDEQRLRGDEDGGLVREKGATDQKAQTTIKEVTPVIQHQVTGGSTKEVDRNVFPDCQSIQLQQASRAGDAAIVCPLLKDLLTTNDLTTRRWKHSKCSCRDEAPALRLCILLWAHEHADGLEFSDIPIEVIKRGADNTRAFIDAIKTSLKIVLRRKICLVGSSFAGKTSFVKSITSELLQPQLEHVDDRTIGIDHFPLRFEQSIASRDDTKIHEVTFWDFAGQNAYQVAHSLFFSPRTLFLVVVDLQAFAIAYMQAAIFANEAYQETKLLDEFVEDAIKHWIRLILHVNPTPKNTVTETLLKDELMRKLRGVGAIVEKMKASVEQNKATQADLTPASIQHKNTVTVATREPRVHFVSCTSPASIEMARREVEKLIMKSERSVPMPDAYTKALDAIAKIRQKVKALDISDQIGHLIVPINILPEKLKVEPGLCTSIMQTLHDLGDVLWYENLDVEIFQKSVILDPLLVIDFIRQVITHKHTGQTLSHTDLKAKSLWRGLEENRSLMEAMKKLMQFFHLVYSASEDHVMEWDSDLTVPAFWQTKTPASWKFLGDILRLKAFKGVTDGERVRVRWEYHFAYGLPLALFDHIVVATVSPFFSFDAGPDWILYEGREGLTACRLMVSRDLRSLLQTVDVEAVVAKAASESQEAEFWNIFQYLVGGFVDILKECPVCLQQ